MINKVKAFLKGSVGKKAMGVSMAISMLCCFAFAETATPVATVTAGLTDVFAGVGTVVSQIASQPILLLFLAASLIPVFIRVFKMLKGAAKK